MSRALHNKPKRQTSNGDPDGLTYLQRRFVDAFIGPANGNASKAARMAGYSLKGSNNVTTILLSNPYVQQAIRHTLSRRGYTPEWCRAELTAIAQGDMSMFLSVKGNKPVIDWKKAEQAGAIGLIKKARFDKGMKVISLELHDRHEVIKTILGMHGLIKSKTEVSGPDGGPVKYEGVVVRQPPELPPATEEPPHVPPPPAI